jgi:hypothetical protein
VCAEREPDTIEVAGSRVRCFLYDERVPAAERPRADWARELAPA